MSKRIPMSHEGRLRYARKQRTMKKLGKALVLTLFLVAIALAYVAIELGY
ncbi:hypothetical protein [Croceibacterium aestuarii]|nr:hypothetical protein [Croceibacterium sp. D39]